jgi:FAD/FMN-containing dehydrogenase
MGILKAVLTVLFKLLLTVALILGVIAAWFYFQSLRVEETRTEPSVVNDITTLNPIRVGKVVRPESEQQIIDAILATDGPISIGGGRYSMGGQSAYPGSLHFDMRSFNRILELDTGRKRIRVQSGVTWRQIQEYIDPHDLSVKVMQDFNNFTVGGSISVNAHGRFNEEGPIIGSVRSIRIILADGKVYEASRENNPALFYAAIGGYGGIGVITEVELDLTDNIKLEREVKRLQFYEFPAEFLSQVLDNDQVVLHQGILYPPNYEIILDVLWKKTDKPLTITDRLQQPVERKWWSRPLVDWLSTSDLLKLLRRVLVDPWIYDEPAVVWRNYETSADLMSRGFATSINKTLAMREYFIPVDKFEIFVLKMRDVFMRHKVPILSVTIRFSRKDAESLLAWAKTDVFSLIVIYQQGKDEASLEKVRAWSAELVRAAIESGGSYYLPFQIQHSVEQFRQAYPRWAEFMQLKQLADPKNRFTNMLWEQNFPELKPPPARWPDQQPEPEAEPADEAEAERGQSDAASSPESAEMATGESVPGEEQQP